jgi:hypothetical protein
MKQTKPEKPRVDLGNTVNRMPKIIPFDFMVDPVWMEGELPKWSEEYWTRRTGYPTSFGRRGEVLAHAIMAGSGST